MFNVWITFYVEFNFIFTAICVLIALFLHPFAWGENRVQRLCGGDSSAYWPANCTLGKFYSFEIFTQLSNESIFFCNFYFTWKEIIIHGRKLQEPLNINVWLSFCRMVFILCHNKCDFGFYLCIAKHQSWIGQLEYKRKKTHWGWRAITLCHVKDANIIYRSLNMSILSINNLDLEKNKNASGIVTLWTFWFFEMHDKLKKNKHLILFNFEITIWKIWHLNFSIDHTHVFSNK